MSLDDQSIDIDYPRDSINMDIETETINYNEQDVEHLIRAGKDVNAAGGEYGSAIQAAGELGRDAILELLLENGANINTRNVGKQNPHGRTALSLAAANGHSLVVRQLLARDDIDADLADNNGRTPLSWAAERGQSTVNILLERSDVDINSKDSNGRTPLSWASGNNNSGIVKILLKQAGINPDARDKNWRTPLSWAAGNGCFHVMKYLLPREDVVLDLKDRDGQTPLSRAAGAGHHEIVEMLLTKPAVDENSADKDGRTPLSWAAEKGQTLVVEVLLRQPNIILNSMDKDGRTALLWAVGEEQEEVVKLLLGKVGIEPNHTDKSGMSPLWLAAKKGFEGVVKLLLAAEKIDTNHRDHFGETVLSWAARTGHDKVVKLLLAKEGLTPDSPNAVGRTALSKAAETGRASIVELLLKRQDVDPDSVDAEYRTPLLWAAMMGHSAVVELLLGKKEVNADSKDGSGRTPLMWALEMRYSHIVRSLMKRDTTTLHSLVQEGDQQSVTMLLSAGYDIDRCDPSGTTALLLAIRRQDREMVRLLLQNGAAARGVMAYEWLNLYERSETDTIQLIVKADGSKHLSFIESGSLGNLKTLSMNQRRLLVIPPNDNSVPINQLFGDDYGQSDNHFLVYNEEIDSRMTKIRVSLSFPVAETLYPQEQFFAMPGWHPCLMAWTIIAPSNPRTRPWQSVDHYSMLPNGWIPDDGIDMFQQIILYLQERWISVCDAADEHLKRSRLDQLRSEGKDPELMRRLARDAQKWTQLRSILQQHRSVALTFIGGYSEQHNANQFPKDLHNTVNEFISKITGRLDQLDQTIRDLLQFEFAWASINESRASTRLGHNVMLFTYVSIFYLPLAFCAAIWAIPNINDSETRNPFIITSVIVGFITLFISFNLENITTLGWRLYQGWRAKVVQDMQSLIGQHWEERGNKLESTNNARSSLPSEWWLIGYCFWRIGINIRALYRRMKWRMSPKPSDTLVKIRDIEVEGDSINN